jgi:6-phosphogluconolactonase
MRRDAFRLLLLILLALNGVWSLGGPCLGADEPIVFISAFAPGDAGAIQACSLDLETGHLTLIHRTTGVEHPFFMAVSPDRRSLYAIHAPREFGGENNGSVAAYRVEGNSGRLTLLNRQSSLGTAACYLEVDATGKMLMVANYKTGSVASFPIRADGSIGEASSFMQHPGDGAKVDPTRQDGPHAHCIIRSPDNRLAFAADLGLDQVLAYRLDVASAKLVPHEPPFVRTPPGAGPRHLTFHPDGRHLYAINELTNSVTLFDYEPKSGSLTKQQTISTLPEGYDGTTYTADVKVTPDGRFLYGTNRGHDSIAAYRIDEQGRLELLEIEPSLGKGPQNLAMTSDGRLLLCANMPGNSVSVFRVDRQLGTLTNVGRPHPFPSPSCLVIR